MPCLGLLAHFFIEWNKEYSIPRGPWSKTTWPVPVRPLAFFWHNMVLSITLQAVRSGFKWAFRGPVVQCGEKSITTWFCLSFRCSRFQSEIKRLKISSPVRVCQNCYYNLQHERSSEDGPRNCWRFTKLIGDPASRLPRHNSQLGRHRDSLRLHISSHHASEVWDSKGTLAKRV